MSNTIFTYAITPADVQANTRTNFTLVMTNGSSSLSLTTNDEIDLALPVGMGATDLTPDLNDINPQAPSNWRFSKNPSGGKYNFVISPTRNTTLEANAILLFQLNNVIINATQGSSQVLVEEFIGEGDGKTGCTIVKSEAVLSIVAQAIPSIVGRNQATTLKWTATKAAYVTILPLSIQVGTVGQEVTIPSKDVRPEAPQVIYSFTAWTPDQKFARDMVTVTISPPVINSFEPENCPPINFDDQVTLSWDVSYAEIVALSLPHGPIQVSSSGSLVVSPKDMLQGNSDIATYTLRAIGAGSPVLESIQIPFNPVAIDYFRYPNIGVTNSYEFNVTNGRAQVDQFVGPLGSYYQLTATGPKGPQVQYLGNYAALQIQVLVANNPVINSGGNVTLTWQTVYATAWGLNANGQTVQIDQQASGSVTLSPTITTLYVLSATDSGGKTITSSLQVVVTA